MNTLSLPRIALLSALAAMSAGAWANSYTIVDLGNLGEPIAVNNLDEIAIIAPGQGKARRSEIYWSGGLRKLPPRSLVQGLNSKGDSVGFVESRKGDYYDTAWLWPRNGDPIEISSGQNYARPLGLNKQGMAVGEINNTDCFVWTASTGLTVLSNNGFNCSARGINDSGQITGTMESDGVTPEAFIWDSGVFTALGTLPGGNQSSGVAINSKGHVAGTSRTEVRGQLQWHAFLWKGQMMVDLDPTLDPSITELNVTAINKSDEVIGWTSHDRDYDSENAVRFAEGRLISLIDELSDRGTWKSLRTATSINDSGVIIGSGDPGNGGDEIYMLIPD